MELKKVPAFITNFWQYHAGSNAAAVQRRNSPIQLKAAATI
jgi:hypothetical protein